jgi:TRAP-type C4-dicarboxylate transport system permease small subunit
MSFYTQSLRRLVLLLAVVAGLGLITMMLSTCVDIFLRVLRIPFAGIYDIVKIAAAVTISCALPYTTAIKGHVAVEFLFHRLGPRGRMATDTLIRLLAMTLFSLLTWQFVHYGNALKKSGEVSMTLQLPVFWVPYVMAFSCAVVVLVTLYHLLHPGKMLLNP